MCWLIHVLGLELLSSVKLFNDHARKQEKSKPNDRAARNTFWASCMR